MASLFQNVLFLLGACVLLFLAYAYLTRWRQRGLQRLPLSGSRRWGMLWPILSSGRAMVKRPPVTAHGASRLRLSALLALLPALAGVLMLVSDAAQPAWSWLWHAALPGFAHDIIWHLLWFNASLLGFVLWDAGMHQDLGHAPSRTIVRQSLLANLVILLGLAGAIWLSHTLDLRELALPAHRLPLAFLQPLGLLVTCVALWQANRRTLVRATDPDFCWPNAFQWQHAGAPFAWLHLTEFLQEVYAAGLLVMAFGGGSQGPAGLSGLSWFLAKVALLLPVLIWFDQRWITGHAGRPSLLLRLAGVALLNLALTAAILLWRASS